MPSPEEGRAELVQKLVAQAERKLGKGLTPEKWAKLFASYDRDKDGRISAGELTVWLEDADVGSFISRGMWVDGIMGTVDRDGNGISLDELMTTLKKGLVDPDLMQGGIERVKKLVRDEFTPSLPSWDSGLLVLLGVGALVLLVDRK